MILSWWNQATKRSRNQKLLLIDHWTIELFFKIFDGLNGWMAYGTSNGYLSRKREWNQFTRNEKYFCVDFFFSFLAGALLFIWFHGRIIMNCVLYVVCIELFEDEFGWTNPNVNWYSGCFKRPIFGTPFSAPIFTGI